MSTNKYQVVVFEAKTVWTSPWDKYEDDYFGDVIYDGDDLDEAKRIFEQAKETTKNNWKAWGESWSNETGAINVLHNVLHIATNHDGDDDDWEFDTFTSLESYDNMPDTEMRKIMDIFRDHQFNLEAPIDGIYFSGKQDVSFELD